MKWVSGDPLRMDALQIAAKLDLNDWYLAAGFVRNLIWDQLHEYNKPTKLDDIDLIYFDPETCSKEKDKEIENYLNSISNYPWSVKNQAYMHERNNDLPYSSSIDAMTYWVELQTAIGAKLNNNGEIILTAPFGLDILFNYSITLNPKRPKPTTFKNRTKDKKWLEKWPKLHISH